MELPKINVPIRIVAGGLDKVERVGSVRAEVLGRIEGATSRTRVICCLLEKPERLAEEIKAFCDNLWLNACAPCGL